MTRIDLKTLENGLGRRDRPDFGTMRGLAEGWPARASLFHVCAGEGQLLSIILIDSKLAAFCALSG